MRVLVFFFCKMPITRKFYAYLMRQKAVFSFSTVFQFLDDLKLLENQNNIFESS